MRDFPSFAGDLKEWSILLNEFKRYTEHFHVPDENNLLRSDAAVKGNIFYLFTYIITWYLVEVVEITSDMCGTWRSSSILWLVTYQGTLAIMHSVFD